LRPAVLDAEVADLGYNLRCYLGLNQARFSPVLRFGKTVVLTRRQRREAPGISAKLLPEFGHPRFEVRVLRDALLSSGSSSMVPRSTARCLSAIIMR